MLKRFWAQAKPPGRLDCSQVRVSLMAHLRNDLLPELDEAVRQHLIGCQACSQAMAEVIIYEEQMASGAAAYQPRLSREGSQRIQLRAERALRKGELMEKRRRITLGLGGLAGLAAVAAIMILGIVYLQRNIPLDLQPSGSPTPSVGGGQAEEGEVTITFAAYEMDRLLYEPVIEEFNRQNHETSVQFVALPDQALDPAALASAADVVLLWSGFDSASSGYFRDLQPLLEPDPNFEMEDFWPGLIDSCRDPDERLLGVPLSASVNGVFYDRGAFDAAGLAYPAPGWTWADFRHAAEVLTVFEDGAPRYGFVDNPHLSASILEPLVGARLAASSGQIDAEVAQDLDVTLQWYVNLARSGRIYPVQDSQDGASVIEAWEKLFMGDHPPAMWVGNLASTVPGETTGLSPDNPLRGLALERYGFAPFPASSSIEQAGSTPVSSVCAVISAGSTHPQEAWAWVSFISRQRLVQNQIMTGELLQAPARRSVAAQSGYWDLLPDDAVEPVQYILDHLWPGGAYRQAIGTVNQALL
ncbi:MAG: extracellular solute-binding protein, partial [Chloroflexota bacterium]